LFTRLLSQIIIRKYRIAKNLKLETLSTEEEMKNMKKCKHERMPASFEIFPSEIIRMPVSFEIFPSEITTALYLWPKGEKFHIPVYSI